ncbi:enoyl-CoA hydratase/isomerase family protein [Hyphococcus sp.]|uniref:enoyl-CoA hydratase/isomerase family protein n=1 Tax=Hyphococcus sp. TaxID=2038636 RepID=UPI00208A36B3|nr:MAG: methylglutaconyl-CoA hydratase [Marinicaulis sp.]
MAEQALITTIDQRGVARLTMNRPDIRNAFNEQLIGEICEAMGRLTSDENVRAIVLTGAGNAFSAGADLNMMKRASGYSAAENKDDARRLAHMLGSIYDSPKPTVALVNGPAMGGGLGLIAACDIAIGADTSFFALSEVRVGLIPAVISPFVIQAITVRQARRYFLSGERFDAAEARRIGLLHKIVSADALNDELEATLSELLVCGPNSQSLAKELIRKVAYRPLNESVMEDTAGMIAKTRASKEGKEGVTAFLEKRKPNWLKGE